MRNRYKISTKSTDVSKDFNLHNIETRIFKIHKTCYSSVSVSIGTDEYCKINCGGRYLDY